MSNPLTWILSLFPMAIGIVLVRHMAKLSEEA
jgi:hypothetical protein